MMYACEAPQLPTFLMSRMMAFSAVSCTLCFPSLQSPDFALQLKYEVPDYCAQRQLCVMPGILDRCFSIWHLYSEGYLSTGSCDHATVWRIILCT